MLTVIFALGLRWVPANSAMVNGWDWRQIILPVMTLVLYDFGYVARMTRASMAEVMTSQYIRTAVLKGLPHRRVILQEFFTFQLALRVRRATEYAFTP